MRATLFLLLRIALFTLVVPASVVVYVPVGLGGSPGSPIQVLLGTLVIAMGLALAAWCFYGFAVRGRGTPAPWDPPRRLVTTPPYRHVRNPMYLGILLVLLGEAALFGSLALLVWSIVVAAAFHLAVTLYEEPGLHERFGGEYDRYLAEVPRWLPRLRPR